MTELPTLVFAWAVGTLLGALFFGGLWWTTRKGISSRQPALWFFGSLVARTSITLTGFYFVSAGHWQRMLLCLLGYAMARSVVMRLTRPAGETQVRQRTQSSHAPQS